MNEPSLSIVIPVLNDAPALAQLLPELLDRPRADIEVLVVDGGSADDLVAVLQQFPVTPLQTGAGRATQLNAGIAAARGQWIWMLHADSRVTNCVLDELLDLSRIDTLRWGRFDVTLVDARRVFRMIEFFMNWRSRLTGISTGDQGIFVRRRVLAEMGNVPALDLMEDIELCKRLKKVSQPFASRHRLLVSARRWQQRGILPTILLMWKLRLLYFLKVAPSRLAAAYYAP